MTKPTVVLHKQDGDDVMFKHESSVLAAALGKADFCFLKGHPFTEWSIVRRPGGESEKYLLRNQDSFELILSPRELLEQLDVDAMKEYDAEVAEARARADEWDDMNAYRPDPITE